MWCALTHRCVLEVKGEDATAFLQRLITQDLVKLETHPALYGLLLSPQGRFLHDFLITQEGTSLFLECEKDRAQDLMETLTRFRLRAKVEMGVSDRLLYAWYGEGEAPQSEEVLTLYQDPRLAALGMRAHTAKPLLGASKWEAYNARRIDLCVPEGSLDMEVGRAIPAEYGVVALNGVDFQKGCFMGQELTARAEFTGKVRKALVCLTFDVQAPAPGTAVFAGDVEIGRTLSCQGNLALARVRLEALGEVSVLTCAGEIVSFHQGTY
ncbi:MAG: folate-binding protein [Candidatus Puniceispirillum sp.]|nr:folate-binding protein [Candidatus Puniceispirillum sp.]